MRILIIATSRSGSTSLIRGLSTIFKINSFGEPFNYGLPSNIHIDYTDALDENCILKTLIGQIPKNYDGDNFYGEYIERFDRIILLSRKNIIDVYESFIYHMVNNDMSSWHNPYYYKDDIEYDENVFKFICESQNTILKLSQKKNIPITWYEDLYSGDVDLLDRIINQWNLDIDSKKLIKYLNPNNRYRKSSENIRLI